MKDIKQEIIDLLKKQGVNSKQKVIELLENENVSVMQGELVKFKGIELMDNTFTKKDYGDFFELYDLKKKRIYLESTIYEKLYTIYEYHENGSIKKKLSVLGNNGYFYEYDKEGFTLNHGVIMGEKNNKS